MQVVASSGQGFGQPLDPASRTVAEVSAGVGADAFSTAVAQDAGQDYRRPSAPMGIVSTVETGGTCLLQAGEGLGH